VLKGKKQGIEAFEPLTREEMELPRVQEYIAAFGLLAQNNHCAREAFAVLSSKYPSDSLARFHLKRLEQDATGAVIIMEDK
jgi:adenylate cyclase